MNEVGRLVYLDALGVTSYVPRVNLPGALPSVLCDLSACELLLDVPVKAEIKVLVDELRGDKTAKDSFAQLQSGFLTVQKTSSPQKRMPIDAVASANPAVQNTGQINVRFQWAILQPTHELLLLIPVAQVENTCMQLLKSILAAIGIDDPVLTPVENFSWPPTLSSSMNMKPVNNSLRDAQETLQALLEGYQLKQTLKKMTLTNVLVFDGNLGKTVFEGVAVTDVQIRILPSLQLMLTSAPEKIAEAKKVTWQKLKDLKKS